MSIDYKDFVSKNKSMLIAPAGYGKTHTIAECLKHTYGKQIILTHTHAGVAAIRDKIKNAKIATNKFHIETITSYAQKYVLAFYSGNDIPDQSNSKEYYPFIIKKAIELVKRKPISEIIKSTYSGLFVDEYQDCTKMQHDFVLALTNILQTRILGDHLQGIFEFNNDSLVDLNSSDMGDFLTNKYVLEEPWRWKKEKGNNEGLGECLKEIRRKISNSEPINLSDYQSSVEIIIADEDDLYLKDTVYRNKLWKLLSEKNLLIIHPISTNISARLKIISSFQNKFSLIESIDDKDFYKIAKGIDNITIENVEKTIRDIAFELFNPSTLKDWFNKNGIIRKTKDIDQKIIEPVKSNIELLKRNISCSFISDTIRKISNLPDIKCYRRELLYTLFNALEMAECDKTTVYEAMKNSRNLTRRVGRRVFGKSIGTTLLTKGLEFDTTAVLNAHKFDCPKNLYVALTRASKRLIIFSQTPNLSPYGIH